MTKIKDTREIIQEMLKENTGRHVLDSGDFYCRHWELNQTRNFDQEPEAWLEVWDGKPLVTINVYHFLVRALTYDPEADQAFQEFAELPQNQELLWLEVMRAFPDWFARQKGLDRATGFYGEGKPILINTYNGEDLLSQVLQYVYFEVDGEGFVILQVHNGCDVRGGYTRPRVFSHDFDMADVTIFDNARAMIYCEGNPRHGWDTDDGVHWYPWEDSYNHLEEYHLEEPEGDNPPRCPICGAPLRAGF